MSTNHDYDASGSATRKTPDEILDNRPVQGDAEPQAANRVQQLTTQGLFIRMNSGISHLKQVTQELAELSVHSSSTPKLAGTLQALACVAGHMDFPPLEPDQLRELIAKAKQAELNKHAEAAAKLVKLELTSLICAEAAITVMHVIDEPIPASCSNLPLTVVAKHLNRTALNITRSIVGLKLD